MCKAVRKDGAWQHCGTDKCTYAHSVGALAYLWLETIDTLTAACVTLRAAAVHVADLSFSLAPSAV